MYKAKLLINIISKAEFKISKTIIIFTEACIIIFFFIIMGITFENYHSINNKYLSSSYNTKW